MGPKSGKLLIWWKSLLEGGAGGPAWCVQKGAEARGLEWREREGSLAEEVAGGQRPGMPGPAGSTQAGGPQAFQV